jgi:putative sterol carrier protein
MCCSPGVAQNNGIFEFRVKNEAGKEAWWTIDLKKSGAVRKGEAKSHGLKPDVTIILSDETFVNIADGKLTGQKAFMTGSLKTKGNMMLATKLDGLLKVC